MKHTLTITWESRWTTGDVLEGDADDREVIRSHAEDLVRDWVDKDAQCVAVSIDGVTLGGPS